MKLLLVVTCLIIPIYAGSLLKYDTSDEVRKRTIVEEKQPEKTTADLDSKEIRVYVYKSTFGDRKSNIPPRPELNEIDADYKLDTSAGINEMNIIKSAPHEEPLVPTTSFDVNEDPHLVSLQNIKSNNLESANLKKEFNGISYEILISTDNGIRNYATLEYEAAVEACSDKRKTLLTFKSAEENAFVANWLFDELKIENKFWIGLTRVNETNDFVWVDGTKLPSENEEKLFKNWHKCEPNDITISWGFDAWGENCVEMYSDHYPYPLRCDEAAKAGQWNDIPCLLIHNMVVCQGKLT